MRRTRAGQRGITIIEFLIVLPILMMLIMATAEFGRAFVQYNALTKTLRDGARFVASRGLFGTTGVVVINPTLQAQTRNLVVYGNIAGNGSPLLPSFAPAHVSVSPGAPGTIVVSAVYPYTPIFASLPLFQFGTETTFYSLQAAVRMRAL